MHLFILYIVQCTVYMYIFKYSKNQKTLEKDVNF